MGLIAGALTGPVKVAADLTDSRFWSEFGGSRKTTSGEVVSPTRALTLGAYFDALRVIAEDVAKLPIHVFEPVIPRGKRAVSGDPVSRVLRDAPNPEMSPFTFRETLTQWAAGWGNGYAEIVLNDAGLLAELWPIHPSRVRPMRTKDRRLFYRVFSDYDPTQPIRDQSTEYVDIPAESMLHIRGMGNDVIGYSVAAFAAESLGVALAAQTFGAAFFANGTQGGGVISHAKTLSEPARDNLRKSWQNLYAPAKSGYSVKVLEEGMTFTPTFVPPNEAQFIETREFQIEDIARWFRLAPHKIGQLRRSSFSNIEQQSIEHVTDTLLPWLVRWEQEIKRKLIGFSSPLFVKHNVDGLMRGDANARANFYRTLANLGALSPNDIREYEDENPIPSLAGDQYYMQTNMATLDRINSGQVQAPVGQAASRSPSEADARAEQAGAQVHTMMPVLQAEADRVLQKEANAVQRAAGKAGFAEWARAFYGEQSAYAATALEPGVAALSRMVAAILGESYQQIDVGAWSAAWCASAAAKVTAAGGPDGIPATHAPRAVAEELAILVLTTYGIALR
jgi:HK97 family phage portal protein